VSVVAPPKPPRPDELEALIREARARQWRRRALFAAAIAVVAGGVGLSVWAAIPGGGTGVSDGGGRPSAAASSIRQIEAAGRRIPIDGIGSSGPVTWAANGGALWLTMNGGKSWRRSVPRDVAATGDPVARVLAADFVDARHGWLSVDDVFGSFRLPSRSASLRHMEIDRTTDGGRTWHASVPPGCLESCVDARLDFLDTRHGFALVALEHGGGKLVSTRDGGATWTLVARTAWHGSFAFVDERNGVATNDYTIRRTTDGGRHWFASRPFPPTFSALGTQGRRLVLFGLRHLRLVAYTSADGGRHWSARVAPAWVRPGLPDNDSAISTPTASDWVVPASPRLFTTHDAGMTWHVVRTADLPRGWSISQIEFTSPHVGWAIFAKGGQHLFRSVLVRTTDGGTHWAPAGPPVRQHRTGK
jgi:photosystem II stability/assembly factor-like uncharacterized protein